VFLRADDRRNPQSDVVTNRRRDPDEYGSGPARTGLTAAPKGLLVTSLAGTSDEAGIKSKVEAIKTAELALAQRSRDALAKMQASAE